MSTYRNIIVKDYDLNLKGVVTINKKDYSLNNCILGETLDLETSGKFSNEKIDKVFIKSKSPNRIKPKCPIFISCGGCCLQHIDYQEQLKIKKKLVEKLFHDLPHPQILNTIGMKDPFHYRNKCQVVFKPQKGKIISGFYEEGTHNLINYDFCYLQDKKANEIIAIIKDLMVKFRLHAYDEDKKIGLLRHVLIKTSTKQEILVVLVTSTFNFPGKNNFIKALVAKCSKITTIIQNVNSKTTNMVLGDKEEIIYGKGYIFDELLNYTFKITSKSFYQINYEQTIQLYQTAIDVAGITKSDVVLDAYCGVGTIGIIASKKAYKVIGVELNPDSVSNAIVNAKLNKIKNVSFFNQDATTFMINLARKKEKIDIIIMDPPRSGATQEFLRSVLTLLPKKIIYISCNPKTQVNDLKILLNKYKIDLIQPVDMFPHTQHIETITLLCLKEPKK